MEAQLQVTLWAAAKFAISALHDAASAAVMFVIMTGKAPPLQLPGNWLLTFITCTPQKVSSPSGPGAVPAMNSTTDVPSSETAQEKLPEVWQGAGKE